MTTWLYKEFINILAIFEPKKELEEISKTPYLFAKNYGDEEFLRAFIPYAKEKQLVLDREITVLNKSLLMQNIFEKAMNFPYYMQQNIERYKAIGAIRLG